jgi:hypothetical protein
MKDDAIAALCLFAAPIIGGLVVVGQMIVAHGSCELMV